MRALRERAELTQVQLAGRTGVKQSVISDFESGKRESIDARSLYALCKSLGATVDFIWEGDAKSTNSDAAEAADLISAANPELREVAMRTLRALLQEPERTLSKRRQSNGQ